MFSEDHAIGIACDVTNIYVTGRTRTAAGDFDFATIAYSEQGVAIWTNVFNGPSSTNDFPAAIVCGANGLIFVTGAAGPNNNEDFVTIAYASEGSALWTNSYNGLASGRDQATAICLGPKGNVGVTGVSRRGGSTYGFATVCYTPEGEPLWTNQFGMTGSGRLVTSSPSGIVADQTGTFYVTGRLTDGFAIGTKWITIALSSSGQLLWSHYHQSGTSSDQPYGVVLDSSGNAYAAGISALKYCTLKYATGATPIELLSPIHTYGMTNSAFEFGVSGPAGAMATIETTTNLMDWVSVTTNSLGSGYWLFKDDKSSNTSGQYYRASAPAP